MEITSLYGDIIWGSKIILFIAHQRQYQKKFLKHFVSFITMTFREIMKAALTIFSYFKATLK